MQKKIVGLHSIDKLIDIINSEGFDNILLVMGNNSYNKLPVRDLLNRRGIDYIRYSSFSQNPKYEEAIEGVKVFRTNKCDSIIAIGGGSALDIAKCIRHFVEMDTDNDCLVQSYSPSKHIKLIAIPTTAGTGSESTHFAVLYKGGVKYSVAHSLMRPDIVILDGSLLKTVPDYHKKSAYMDALSQAIESWWSKRANDESIRYSKQAIEMLLKYRKVYMDGSDDAAQIVLEAANYAGEAINITTTTAAHAMSYKLTSLYGLSHGHAVALCLPVVWRAIAKVVDNNHPANKGIPEQLGTDSYVKAIEQYNDVLLDFGLYVDGLFNIKDLDLLCSSVNLQRLKNNPIEFSYENLKQLYKRVLIK